MISSTSTQKPAGKQQKPSKSDEKEEESDMTQNTEYEHVPPPISKPKSGIDLQLRESELLKSRAETFKVQHHPSSNALNRRLDIAYDDLMRNGTKKDIYMAREDEAAGCSLPRMI